MEGGPLEGPLAPNGERDRQQQPQNGRGCLSVFLLWQLTMTTVSRILTRSIPLGQLSLVPCMYGASLCQSDMNGEVE